MMMTGSCQFCSILAITRKDHPPAVSMQMVGITSAGHQECFVKKAFEIKINTADLLRETLRPLCICG
jgi:hypothetical protein